MANLPPKNAIIKDLSQAGRTAFTLTFAIELLGIEVWHDCNDGWLDLGPCINGMKIQYQLYPGQNYDIDLLIWPHAVKIWCGMNSGWVRTWQFLERRWLTFGISHLFPVRVMDLQAHMATITPTIGIGVLGANAKNDKVDEVYLPRLEFGQQRYFAPVIAEELSLETFLYDLIWKTVEGHIPVCYLDKAFDVPHPVTVVRHQDTVLFHVRENILGRNMVNEPDQQVEPKKSSASKIMLNQMQKKKPDASKPKFEIQLSGDRIVAGIGRQVPFETVGERPPEMGEILVFISSENLPASDDSPIFFINIGTLFDVPSEALTKYKISHIYTQWSIAEEVHSSEPQPCINSKTIYEINDDHAVPLPCDIALNVISGLMDEYFQIQLRGIRYSPKPDSKPEFFGYDKNDRVFGTNFPPKFKNYETDIIIATTKIAAKSLAKGISGVVNGDYSLYPPVAAVASLGRECFCTNDQNGIRLPLTPEQVIPSYVILDAQMTLQVRMGYAGCRPQRLERCYSRMICLITDSWLILELLKKVDDINFDLEQAKKREEFLTGFAVDTGDTVIFYVEGPKDGAILQVWEKTGDYYSHTKPVFSSSARYASRIYPATSFAGNLMPFMVTKMYVPISAILACPPVYARPVLPVLARHAVLKFGRLLANKLRWLAGPPTSDLPTPAELVSFRQELCVAPSVPAHKLQCNIILRALPVSSVGWAEGD